MAKTTSSSSQIQKILDTTQGKTYTVILVTAVVIVLMVTFAIAPAYLSITDQFKENEEKRVYIAALDDKQEVLNTLAQQELDYTDQIQILEDLYPNQSDDEFVLANLDAMALHNRCRLMNVTYSRDIKNLPESGLAEFTGLARAPIHVELQGELADLQLFLTQLEQFPVSITINSLTYGLTPRNNSQEQLDEPLPYTLSIEAEYFYWSSSS